MFIRLWIFFIQIFFAWINKIPSNLYSIQENEKKAKREWKKKTFSLPMPMRDRYASYRPCQMQPITAVINFIIIINNVLYEILWLLLQLDLVCCNGCFFSACLNVLFAVYGYFKYACAFLFWTLLGCILWNKIKFWSHKFNLLQSEIYKQCFLYVYSSIFRTYHKIFSIFCL